MQVFYDKKAETGNDRDDRERSPIISLRKFNNWIKACLINEYTRKGDRALDLCGGKGGDLAKWQSVQIKELKLVDLSEASVTEAERRYRSGKYSFSASFESGDVRKLTPVKVGYNVVSCQFALHYCFESKEIAHATLHGVASQLVAGGIFIATIPNTKRIQLFAGNPLCKITRSDNGYTFWLCDAIDAVFEYYVDETLLIELAASVGLTPIVNGLSFEEYAKLHSSQLPHMRPTTMSAEEFSISCLYDVYVFRKR